MTRNVNGFTLIELMVVLSIVAIIAMQASPSFSGFYERTQTRIIVNDLIRHINFSRNYAINTNSSVIICGSADGLACERSKIWSGKRLMVYIDHNNDNVFDADDDELLRLTDAMPDGSFFAFRAFRNRNFLKWIPAGTTDTQNGNFTYCPPSGNMTLAKHLIINVVGRIYSTVDTNNDGIVEKRNGDNVSCI